VVFSKSFPFKERYGFCFGVRPSNLTNTVIRPGPDTTFTSETFGQLPKIQNNFPRVKQVAAKFYF
jgi:hypothetical protein